jgi:ABC-type transport system involved in multi-copper enzyme maturation permease subunit
MLRKMIVKEWKEKSGLVIFGLAVLLLFSLAFSAYSKDLDTLDYLVSTLVLIFPSVMALLLGASGFAYEFHDGAWAYLFSRPVSKRRIWFAKYLSLLAVLFLVILLFSLLIRLHPALASAGRNFDFSVFGEGAFGFFGFVLPLLLFTVAFSLSILSDKPYSALFLTALISLALQLVLTRIIEPLLYPGLLRSALSASIITGGFLALSLFLASLITLNKADFSQPRSRVWTFTKSAVIIFPLMLVLTAAFMLGAWKLRSERYIYDLEARSNAFYFATDKGFFMFDLAEGRTEKIARHPSMWGQMSLGGDKVVFVDYHLGGSRQGFAEIKVMKSDGKDERSLVQTWDSNSPLYGSYFLPIQVSPLGDRAAFIARHAPKTTAQELWVINIDGSDLRGYDLGIPEIENSRFISFGMSGREIYLLCTIKIKPGNKDQRTGARLLRVNLESGQVKTIAERIRKPYAASAATEASASGTALIAYLHFDEAVPKEILTVLNPEILEEHQVYPEDSVTEFRWNAAGDKLAFLTVDSKLGVYSVAEKRVVKIGDVEGYDLRWPSQALEWTDDGRLILRKFGGEASQICFLDTDLTEQKALQLPFTTYYPARIWSAGNYVVVEDTEKHQLWGFDLETEKWLRVY